VAWSYNWDLGLDAFPSTSNAENVTGVVYQSGGTKIVTFNISNGYCTETFSNTITINSRPIAKAGIDTIICADRSVQIGSNSIAGNTYSWYPTQTLSNPFISNPLASPTAGVTNYFVNVTDANNCQNSDSILVTMLPPLSANAGIDLEICYGERIQIGSSLIEGQQYSWSPSISSGSDTLSNPMAQPDSTTIYTVTVIGAGCDPVTDNMKITVHQLPNANAGSDTTIAEGLSIQLIGTGGLNYSWSPIGSLSNAYISEPIATPDLTTVYYLLVGDNYGCENIDSVQVSVVTATVWLPNTFTPNNDGQNDILYVRGTEKGVLDFEYALYDHLGQRIFKSTTVNLGWDGRHVFTKEEMPTGAYVYVVKGTDMSGNAINLVGLVNLVR